MMQTHSFALWMLKTVRYITNIVLFFLLILCPVQVLLLPAMKRAARNLLHICKMFCCLKWAHKGSFLCTDITFLVRTVFNPLNTELNPICHLLTLLGVHHFLHVSRIKVKSLTLRLLMSYIYIYVEHLFLMFLDHTQ